MERSEERTVVYSDLGKGTFRDGLSAAGRMLGCPWFDTVVVGERPTVLLLPPHSLVLLYLLS